MSVDSDKNGFSTDPFSARVRVRVNVSREKFMDALDVVMFSKKTENALWRAWEDGEGKRRKYINRRQLANMADKVSQDTYYTMGYYLSNVLGYDYKAQSIVDAIQRGREIDGWEEAVIAGIELEREMVAMEKKIKKIIALAGGKYVLEGF